MTGNNLNGIKRKKSYVRIKVWLATPVFISGLLYSALSYILSNYRVEQMSSVQVGAFIIAMASCFYLHSIKCERCKTKWFETGRETYSDATSILDFVGKFVAERRYKISQKCQTCEFDCY